MKKPEYNKDLLLDNKSNFFEFTAYMIRSITPFLWFDNQAEEATQFYTSIFDNSKVISSNAMSTEFELVGSRFMALNGGPAFKFTEAISLFVSCETQDEVDSLWEKLSEGGSKSQCGWLKDKYGLSWQIVPTILSKLAFGEDNAKSQRVMKAMLKMTKIIIADLQKAYDGETE